MLKHYFKITVRSLSKQLGYSVINVLGLAVGLAFCTLIVLFVRDELTHDRFHAEADHLYRVLRVSDMPNQGIFDQDPYQPIPLAPALMEAIPEVEQAVRFYRDEYLIGHGDLMQEEMLLFADPAMLEVFSFPLRHGDPRTALADLNSIVLTETAAQRYFGTDDVVGETMQVRLGGAFHDVTITGVAHDVPSQSSISFDYLLPYQKLPDAHEWIRNRMEVWRASSAITYVKLQDGASAQAVEAKMRDLRATHFPDEAANLREMGLWEGTETPIHFALQPLADIHLNPTVGAGLKAPSDPRYAYILGGIALAILLLACINFTTLAIGRSASRAREVGIRKAVGAPRAQLMALFWGEALLLTGLALVLGLALAEAALPVFNTLANKALDLTLDVPMVAALGGLLLLTGLAAGSYPALRLSGLRPLDTLRQRLRLGGSNRFTQALVVFQFAISIFFIAGTLVMLQQLHFLQNKNLGFNDEQLVVLPTQGIDGEDLRQRLETRLAGQPGVRGITGVSSSFTRGYSREGFEYNGELKEVYSYRVEDNYVDVMEMELVAGRNFNPHLATDSTQAILVNEAMVRDFGWTNPIGEQLVGFYTDPVVVGVVKDFNFRSLHETVEPMVLLLDPDWGIRHLLVRIAPDDIPAMLETLRTAWADVADGVPFNYSFLDDDVARQYDAERRWNEIVAYAAGFAVLIACLGLFGLAALTVTGRTKEIGIRKVLGATISDVTFLLSKNFLWLVLIGFGVAAPLAYLAAQEWLQDFAYRIDLGVGIFLAAGASTVLIALVTVSYQAIRAAIANPVKSLRYE